MLCQQAGERHTGPYCSDSYWEGKKLIPVMGSSGPGCRKPLLTRVQSMAGQSQASQGTAQPRFYCICLNRIPRAGEFSPQHRKYPRHRRLHLILNCSLFFLLLFKLFGFKLSMVKVNLRLNFPGSGIKMKGKHCLAPALTEKVSSPVPWCTALLLSHRGASDHSQKLNKPQAC